MKLKLTVIGANKSSFIEEGIHNFQSRIKHYYPFELSYLRNVKKGKKTSTAQLKAQEAELILKQLVPTDYLILLDEKGKTKDSVEMADWLQLLFNRGYSTLHFMVGGAFGFDDKVYQKANELLSLSKMTFSHQLIRLMFLEQLYRSCTIIRGESYHHA